ncbi:MAG: DUF2282 domain-containing protein [Acidiferrobacterales bacterium]|nr:DUF2282 domain-containing protein [Acidiferrobacterales bacterium]
MKRAKTIVHSAVASVATLAVLGIVSSAQAQPPAAKPNFGFEKCYGIAKAGNNDCQTASGACAGSAKLDQQADAWVYLPKGTCGKIYGASLEPQKKG